MKKVLTILLMLAALTVVAGAQAAPVVTVLKGFDPIELIDGREVAGSESISITRGKYRYLFATEANKRKFEKSPEEHQIQLGGGCGRMGSLSGAGNPDRYYVFDRRIYIFASEQCRNGFKAAPEKHLEAPDAPPSGTPAELRRGRELVALALKGLGGAARVDGIKTYQARIKLSYQQGDKVSDYYQTQSIEFPGRYRDEYDWGSSKSAMVLTPGAAMSEEKDGAWIREEPVRAALERQIHRNPLAILKARRDPGFVAVAAGKATIGDHEVELLKVGIKGATTSLAIDAKTGRIVQTAYRDRQGAFGDVVKTYSDFREVSGLILPFKVEESFNGKPVTSPVVTYESVRINGPLDTNLFRKP